MNNINVCNSMDLGVVGPKFMGRGPLFNGHTISLERLDRGLCNDN